MQKLKNKVPPIVALTGFQSRSLGRKSCAGVGSSVALPGQGDYSSDGPLLWRFQLGLLNEILKLRRLGYVCFNGVS